MPIVLDGSLGVTTPMYNGTITANAVTPSVNMKNRIINGAMVISQRNGTSSVTPTDGQYVLDRWKQLQAVASKYSVQQNAGSVTPPAGFVNYLGITSLSSYSVGAGEYFITTQVIEGYNIADLTWGTANAKTVTLSFWVRSSLTGTFGGAVTNNSNTRSYPFTYTISSANTWEQKSITVAGDTSGSWATDNAGGIQIKFGLGVGSSLSGTAGAWAGADYASATGATSVVGTNGATFYITGIQFEVGSTATSFDYRPYGTELVLCQRYCQVLDNALSEYGTVGYAIGFSSTYAVVNIPLVVSMRTKPSSVTISSNSHFQITNYNTTVAWSSFSLSSSNCTPVNAEVEGTTGSGLTAGNAYVARGNNNTSGKLTFSAEL